MERALEAARRSGLIEPDRPLLVLLSGGADSTCLLDVAVRLGADTSALHVNYGLREGADADEEHCRALCERLGVPLQVERVRLPERGNLQAAARHARYEIAERVAKGSYAAAHTASDQAETILYRLAVSPGRRALLGMPPRSERLVRPLLEATAEDTRDYCRSRGLEWREDPSNADRRFARARIRHDVLPALGEIGPAAERSIAETAAQLREEEEVLSQVVSTAEMEVLESPSHLTALRALPRALARLVLRHMAEAAGGGAGTVPLSRAATDAILRLGVTGGSASLDVGGGVRAVVEYGRISFTRAREEADVPDPVELPVPGSARFGDWTLSARLAFGPGDREVVLSAEELGERLTVRSWRDGDRMRPAGLGGSKSLQDLFTDRKIPRAARRQVPVVVSGDEIVWVPTLAVGERFLPGDGPTVALSALSVPS